MKPYAFLLCAALVACDSGTSRAPAAAASGADKLGTSATGAPDTSDAPGAPGAPSMPTNTATNTGTSTSTATSTPPSNSPASAPVLVSSPRSALEGLASSHFDALAPLAQPLGLSVHHAGDWWWSDKLLLAGARYRIDAQASEKAVIWGHSAGGWVALERVDTSLQFIAPEFAIDALLLTDQGAASARFGVQWQQLQPIAALRSATVRQGEEIDIALIGAQQDCQLLQDGQAVDTPRIEAATTVSWQWQCGDSVTGPALSVTPWRPLRLAVSGTVYTPSTVQQDEHLWLQGDSSARVLLHQNQTSYRLYIGPDDEQLSLNPIALGLGALHSRMPGIDAWARRGFDFSAVPELVALGEAIAQNAATWQQQQAAFDALHAQWQVQPVRQPQRALTRTVARTRVDLPVIDVVAPQNVLGVARNRYANFGLSTVDSALLNLDLEVSLKASVANAKPTVTVWPSDLYVINDNRVFASYAISSKEGSTVWRDHISAGSASALGEIAAYFDPNIMGGNWGGIANLSSVDVPTGLIDGVETSLCHGRHCRVDILTGGLDLLANPSLTPKERATTEILLHKTLIERLVIPLVEQFIPLLSDQQKALFGFALSYWASTPDFARKFAAAGNAADVLAVYSDYAIGVLENVLTRPDVLAKIVSGSTGTTKAAANAAMQGLAKGDAAIEQLNNYLVPAKVAARANVIAKAIELLDWAATIGEIAFTPKRIRFEIFNKAEISSAKLLIVKDNNTPQYDLTLIGRHLNPELEGQTPVYPSVVLRDSSSTPNEARWQLASANYIQASTDETIVEVRESNMDLLVGWVEPISAELQWVSSVLFDDYPEDRYTIRRELDASSEVAPSLLGTLGTIGVNNAIPLGSIVQLEGNRLPQYAEAVRFIGDTKTYTIPIDAQERANPSSGSNSVLTFTLKGVPIGDYRVEVQFVEAVKDIAINDPVFVTVSNIWGMTMADTGVMLGDDTVKVEFFRSINGTQADTSATITPAHLKDGANFGVPFAPKKIIVRCINGGQDGQCTPSLRLSKGRFTSGKRQEQAYTTSGNAVELWL